MKKNFVCIFLTLALLISLVACGSSQEEANTSDESSTENAEVDTSDESGTENTEVAASKTYKIGINNYGQANFFAREGKAALEDELALLGCEVVATVTDNTTDRMNAIESMIQQGCDAIIIEEGDVLEVETALVEAKEAGIVIGSMDAGTSDYVDIYVSSDNTSLGKTITEVMVDAIGGEGKIIEIIYDSGSMIRARKEGMYEVLEDYPDIEVAYSLTYEWPDYYADMKSKVEAVLLANPNPGDISAVWAAFDGVGIAAYDAIKEAGLQDSIVVVGIDGDSDAYELMREENSNYICTCAQDPEAMARLVCQRVVQILNGETLESNVEYVDGVLITQDNIPEDE